MILDGDIWILSQAKKHTKSFKLCSCPVSHSNSKRGFVVIEVFVSIRIFISFHSAKNRQNFHISLSETTTTVNIIYGR